MIHRFSLPRLFGVLAAVSCTCATLAVAAQVAPPSEKTPPDTSGTVILDIAAPKKGDMPPVAFDHNKHTQGERPGETCASCHDGGALSAIEGKTGKELENAFHDTCLTCHAEIKAKGKASPPQKAECRSCHDANALPATKNEAGKKNPQRTDGGFDSSLHARHAASDKITVTGSADNCASCHHPTTVPLSSPALKADSCRSCHAASATNDVKGAKGADNAPPYSKVAHKTCITCHETLSAKGANLPLTCDSCHNAAKKAGYAKLNPAPRLVSGQPDTVIMGAPSPAISRDLPIPAPKQSLPDASLANARQQQPSMDPVIFDHKLHEASVDTCRTCHMPTGKGPGSVTVSMHKADADLSCMSCHNTIKTAKLECAGCHAIMPKTKATEARCESCHTLSKSKPPVGALEREALAKAPADISIGALANEYEPSVFPHKRVVESLIAGMEKSSPGMMQFHSTPYALCASCHHYSPPSAKPPTCASCHSKTGTNVVTPSRANNTPSLQAAYHQQCISCHTAMNIKPAATDCAGCHAKRVTPGKIGKAGKANKGGR